MPMRPFDGSTFVAFCDIAGFKAALKESRERAGKMLDAFYSAGFHAIRGQQRRGVHVDGLFVSDCGVMFAQAGDAVDQLRAILAVLSEIHGACHENAVSVATAIAYGPFKYDERYVIPGVDKNLFYGSAYLAAFADSTARLYHPDIRLLKADLPEPVRNFCLERNNPIGAKIRDTPRHFYYEWQRR